MFGLGGGRRGEGRDFVGEDWLGGWWERLGGFVESVAVRFGREVVERLRWVGRAVWWEECGWVGRWTGLRDRWSIVWTEVVGGSLLGLER